MKYPKVSVLVHTRNSIRTIDKHLESITNQSYKNIEIVVVDNFSTDGTLEIARKYTKFIYSYGPERSAQRNYGANKSSGEYLLVPDSDMILSKHVVSACVDLMMKNSFLKAVIIPERSIGEGFWAKCKELERSYYEGVDWMEAARFFEKKIFDKMGGYDERNTGTEDYDLPQRIRRKFGDKSIGRIKEYIYHDEGKLTFWHSIQKKFYYSKSLCVYKQDNFLELYKQGNVLKRYILFFSRPEKLFRSPLIAFGMFIMKAGEFAAEGLAYVLTKSRKV